MKTEVARMHFRPMGMLALARKAWGEEYEVAIVVSAAGAPAPFAKVGDLAVVDIKGPLVNHKHPAWDSYEAILERADAAFDDQEVKRVCMRINSPGGDVDGCFDAARRLRFLAKFHGKELIAYADGQAASAAYALACAADRIVLSSTSTVGSIGIIEGLRDQTLRDRAMGENFVIVTSGAHKADGNPHVAITEKAVKNLQGQVDGMADLFFELVEELRGFPAEKARALEARMLFGEQAVGAGLADEVSTWSTLAHEPVPMAQSGPGESPMTAKAMNLRQHMAWAAEHGDDEEKEMAKRCLSALAEGEGDEGAPPEKKKEEAEGKKASAEGEGEGKKAKAEGEGEGKKASAEGEGEGKKAKAEGEGEGKKAAVEEKEAKAKAGDGDGDEDDKPEGKKAQALAARVQALEAENYAREQSTRRAALMASRPDLAAEVVAWLDSEPIGVVERAIKTLPKGKGPSSVTRPAAASQAMPVRASGHTGDPDDVSFVPEDQAGFIARKMGVEPPPPGVKNTGRALELGFMSSDDARAFLDKKLKVADPSAKGA